jgi:DUF971 family protein
MPTPASLARDDSARELRITWSDGHASRYAYRMLRQRCPCALCVHEWTGDQLLDASAIPEDIVPREIAPVGAYALRFTWSDGHMTGIYTFTFLRSLCQCPACAAAARPPSPEGEAGSQTGGGDGDG